MLRTLLPTTALLAFALAAPAGAATVKAPSSVKVTEGKSVPVQVTLAKKAAKRTVVRWTLAGSADFARTKGAVTIPRGKRAGTLRLATKQDTSLEGDERFSLKLDGKPRVKVVLVDDDRPALVSVPTFLPAAPPAPPVTPEPPVVAPEPPAPALPTVSITDLTRSEGAGDDAKKPEVVLSAPSKSDVVVHVSADGEGASQGADFEALDADVTIKAGQAKAPVPLKVLNDLTDEQDTEDIDLTLTATQGATIDRSAAKVLITDDDPKPTLSVGDGEPRLENATTMPFDVKLSHPSVHAIYVSVSTLPGSAAGGQSCGIGTDFVSISGLQMMFAPGETKKTIGVAICEDGAPEGDETVKLAAFNVSSMATIGDNHGVGTIQNDAD